MNNSIKKVNMGVILCRHCNSQIDTVDTNRIVTFYSVCDQPECQQLHSRMHVSVSDVIDEE
ncbi:GapA-binding peptide SR1P [Paenibacillus lautus]|uniref:GapA-binding peptide SR1P n=1 Tax=Paenibacillus lautus TaxID=1401 RepID=UPI003D2DF6A0